MRHAIRQRISAAIEDAARGGRPYIAAKVNALVDTEMIGLLDDAAARGVTIDLIVRGMCGLIPDPDRHEGRLHIRSVIGEFLEHSRLYHFNIAGRAEWFAGSADLMDRNLDRRVEVLFPLLIQFQSAAAKRCCAYSSPTVATVGSCSQTVPGSARRTWSLMVLAVRVLLSSSASQYRLPKPCHQSLRSNA